MEFAKTLKTLIRRRATTTNEQKNLKDEVLKEIYRREQSGGLWGQLVVEWVEALEKGSGTNRPVGISTVENYRQILMDYTKKWWRLPAAEITRADVR